MDELEKNYQGKITFVRLDEESPSSGQAVICQASKFGLASTPGFVFYDARGNKTGAVESFQTRAQLQQQITDLLQGNA